MYDYIIVTHVPAFYVVNLYNQFSNKINIFVIFIANDTNEKRSDDFITIEKARFKYKILHDGNFQDRNQYKNIRKIRAILRPLKYKRLLVSGWDLSEFWYLVFFNKKNTNFLALESTKNENRSSGIKRLLKRFFLSRIAMIFASGVLHLELLNVLKYKENVKIVKGVGIINKPEFSRRESIFRKRFLFIGRLSKVKNIEILINIFNNLNEYQLTIVGLGEEYEYFKSISNKNIIYKGSIKNKSIKHIFFENDVLILPSISEPWGLVVEEALYFELPCIVSKNCGVSQLIEDGVNGYLVDCNDENSIKGAIEKINNSNYSRLVKSVRIFSIDKKDSEQVGAYLLNNI
jgi:glycosyltransferase involved in cell wall biosynthesis